jgi:hypothetical protein
LEPNPKSASLSGCLMRAGDACLRSALEALGRLEATTVGHASGAARRLLGPSGGQRTVWENGRALAIGYANWLRDTALIPGIAAFGFLDALGRSGSDARGRRTVVVEGRPVMLPARIHAAAQGSAYYLVAADAVRRQLDGDSGRFRVLEVWPGRTLVTIFMIDYRESDLGSYYELGVAFFVVPKQTVGAPGMLICVLPVSEEFSRAAGRQIWGYPKQLMAEMSIDYAQDQVSCSVDRSKPDVLSIALPRGGEASSLEIPLYTYTVRDGETWCTRFVRSGRREEIRVRSWADLRLASRRNRNCLCRGAPEQPCICETLRDLGLPKPPLFTTWTEHLSGRFEQPHPMSAR